MTHHGPPQTVAAGPRLPCGAAGRHEKASLVRGAAWLPILLAVSACRAPEPERPAPRSWEVICAWLRDQTDQLTDDMASSREVLLKRAEVEEPELVVRLEPAPAQPSGWGLLPELEEDGPTHGVTPRERKYALESISVNFASTFRDGRVLAEHTSADPDADLERAVGEYERVRSDLKNLQAHLAYHEQWQAAVADQTAYFEKRNTVIANARELDALLKASAQEQEQKQEGEQPAEESARVLELRAEIREVLEVFHPVSFLAIEEQSDGTLELPVSVLTDIPDEAFLAAFRAAVDEAWNGAQAARERGFSIRLEILPVPLSEIYPENPPEVGQEIDPVEHVARFPPDTLVMTTGGRSTHAWKGRCLVLGPGDISPRTLAHEFGHLLGFSDAYLRGFDGQLDDRFGVVLVEWTGLLDDLMGNVSGGIVRENLVDRLVDAYGPEGDADRDD
jgi:hypothetical protein